MSSIAKELKDVQLVLMCGHNQALATRLRGQVEAARGADRAGRLVVGFTPDVRRHMRVSDFFVGKPGPGSLSEALQQGLPVVTVRNAWTMPQERDNTEWIAEHRVGVVGTSMRRIGPEVAVLVARLDAYRATVAAMRNRAVFEVPDILATLLAQARPESIEPGVAPEHRRAG